MFCTSPDVEQPHYVGALVYLIVWGNTMSNVYQFPRRGKAVRRFIISPFLKLCVASFFHYITLTPMLLVSRFRFPLLILGAAYVLNFFYSHHHNLWAASDYTGLYVLLAWCGVLLNELLVFYVERSRPFHRMLSVNDVLNGKDNSANDD